MKLEVTQQSAFARLTVRMQENCHGDTTPPVDAVHFNGVNATITPDTAALSAAIVASRWTGEVLEFRSMAIGVDAAEAVRLVAENARFVTPVDGYRRSLCEGHIDVLAAPTTMAGCVLSEEPDPRVLTRLVTWSGEFVSLETRSSAGYVAGEVSTNADLLLPAWEVSVALGLLVGGESLRSIATPHPEAKYAGDLDRFAKALRVLGVQLRTVGAEPLRRILSAENAPSRRRDRSAGEVKAERPLRLAASAASPRALRPGKGELS
jgi:hypothetical protein